MKLIVAIEKKLKTTKLQIDFVLKDEVLGILGASGSGKSMLLKCIAGIETPDKGYIQLNEKVLFDSEKGINLPPQERKIGLMFQQYALFPNMTVLQNIECVSKDKQNNHLLIQSFNLEEVKDSYPQQLSGGQKQRVALARMLASTPELLLFDEPFSALDEPLKEVLQKELQDRMSQINKKGLIVSHSLDELYRLCSELLVITSNQSIIGPTNELFKQPQIKEVAELTGCKNIFAISNRRNNQIEIEGWSHPIDYHTPLTQKFNYIGLRAHEFKIEPRTKDDIGIEVEFCERQLTPFEQNIWFKHGNITIWWKGEKSVKGEKIKKLWFSKDDLMLLK